MWEPAILTITTTTTRLLREASIRSRRSGDKGISAKSLRQVMEVSRIHPLSKQKDNSLLPSLHTDAQD